MPPVAVPWAFVMVVELITKYKNGNLQCVGRCKLIINSLTKVLLIDPSAEEIKLFRVMFIGKFVAQKNILFVIAENDFQDFALIFDYTKKCNKVYDFLLKNGAAFGSTELVYERFLPGLLNLISPKTDESSSKTKEILLKWIELHDDKEKVEFIQILKGCNADELIKERQSPNLRKRKARDICYKEESSDENNGNCKNKSSIGLNLDQSNYKIGKSLRMNPKTTVKQTTVEAPNFEILKYVIHETFKTKLTVFPSTNRKKCYEYFWYKSRNCFMCTECRILKNHSTTAKIIKRNGKDIVQINGAQHICKMKEYNAIIEKPNFMFVTFEREKIMMERLIIFMDSFQDKCYEYTSRFKNAAKIYYCCGCLRKRIYIRADICQNEDGTEFVMLKSNDHVCEPRKYNPEKFAKKEIVEADNFKVFEEVQDGKDKSKMVIFASTDKSKCYEYYLDNFKKAFCCCGCNNLEKCVVAELCQHEDGSKYLKLSREKHVCEPREYDPEKFDIKKKEIIEPQNFKIFNYKHNGSITSRLVVFCETNKNLCYEYYKMKDTFHCCSCPQGSKATAILHQKEDSKPYIILSKNQHVCELIEFDPEKYKDDVIVEKEMYSITSTTYRNMKNKIMNVFTSKEKKFYYKFVYKNHKKCFYCSNCLTSKIHITATLQNEGKENEFLNVSSQKHVCEPFEYNALVDNKIIMAPNYRLVKRKANGKIVQRMVVFTNEEKSECFEYSWMEEKKWYLCFACQRQKAHIIAKMFKNDKNEECIELSSKPHKCNPIKFVPENITPKIVKAPNFKLFKAVYNQKNVERLAIFDSKDRNYGYIYTFQKHSKIYVCSQCTGKKKHISAKVLKDENGQSYVELGENEHVCELQKI